MTARTDVYTPVMGTVLEITVDGAGHLEPVRLADTVADAVLGEIGRLGAVLSGHDPASELSRWRRGETAAGPELTEVLSAAARLFAVTGGAVHPALGPLLRIWLEAERVGRLPDPTHVRAVADRLSTLPFCGGVRTGDCTGVDLDALAKGYVVDAALLAGVAAARATAAGAPVDVTVNAGGDLRHAGPTGRRVRIEDPGRPHDNAPPLTSLPVRDAALATSGTARRGVRIGGRHLGHVLDPRTGWPVGHTGSASVLAPSVPDPATGRCLDRPTLTADAVATAALVLAPDAALDLVGRLGLVALLVTADGAVLCSPGWPDGSDRPGLRR